MKNTRDLDVSSSKYFNLTVPEKIIFFIKSFTHGLLASKIMQAYGEI